MMNDEVRTIMTKDMVVVHPDQTIQEITELMNANRVQQVPVVENGEFQGLITVYDLWRGKTSEGAVYGRDVMTTKVIKIAPKDKVGTAAELFMDNRFKSLPVINLRNELKGMVTAFDVIKYSFKKEYPNPILYKDVLSQ